MFKNLKFSTKLFLGFAVVIILSSVVAFMGIKNMQNLSDITDKFYKHSYTNSTSILTVERDIIAMHREMKDIAMVDDPIAIQNHVKKIEEYEQNVFKYLDLLYERFLGDVEVIDRVYESFSNWKPIRDDIIRYSMEGRKFEAGELTRLRGAKHVQLILDNMEEATNFVQNKAMEFQNNALNEYKQAKNIMILVTAIIYVVALLVALIITKGITSPVLNSVKFAQEIANGNLAEEPLNYKAKDEIGILVAALNKMHSQLKLIIQQVVANSGDLTASSQQLSAASEQISQTAVQVGTSIQQIATGAEEQTSQITDTASNIQHLMKQINLVTEKSREMAETGNNVMGGVNQGTDSVSQAIRQIQNIKGKVANTSAVIQILGDKSNAIGNIVGLINGIASQTNLLALNAAIEAARAGEQGRGFAVVAEEVRQLAEESAQATNDITSLINEIQRGVTEAMTAMAESTIEVEAGTTVIENTEKAFYAIYEMAQVLLKRIEEVTASSKEMALNGTQAQKAVQEIAAVSEEFAANAEEVAASSDEQVNITEEIAQSARQLAELSGKLFESVAIFKL